MPLNVNKPEHCSTVSTSERDVSSYDEGPDLVLYYKYLMVLNGERAYNLHFNPTDKLSKSQMMYAKKQYLLFKEWYKNWKKN